MKDHMNPDTWSDEKVAKLVTRLRDAGLNPNAVVIEGIDENGYDEVQNQLYKVADGVSYYDGDKIKTVRREWPEGFDWLEFLDILMSE